MDEKLLIELITKYKNLGIDKQKNYDKFYLYSIITCLLYTSDAADDLLCVDLGGRRIIKKKKNIKYITN